MNHRSLTEKEIATLTVYGCSAENWNLVTVAEDFTPGNCNNIHFTGTNRLGTFNKVFQLKGGVRKHAGIYNVHLHNCTVGNDVYINNIHNYIANYEIGTGAYLEHIDALITEPGSNFGSGTEVNVLIESGQRAIRIFPELSAPLAYIMTFHRDRSELQNFLNSAVDRHIKPVEKGKIGQNASIMNTGWIENVNIGDSAHINGTSLLKNGDIASSASAPTKVGYQVIARDFIIQSGSVIDNGSQLERCLIGQACLIDKQFSVLDSVLFSNCQGFHGEAVSVFGGPFTVSHHKSTLLLAAYYSFYNAGSGTNFSNHMYKLGPVHQGITERGVKTSSNSYLMWPARIGAYSVVLGSHKGNPDISKLPFSYLMESDGESHLLPAINLHSAGTRRDVKKWIDRDLRKDNIRIDDFVVGMFIPTLILKMEEGIEVLKDLQEKMDPQAAFVWYQNCKIKKSAIRKGIELYTMAIDQYLGEFLERVKSDSGADTLKNELNTEIYSLSSDPQKAIQNYDSAYSEWLDLSGMLVPGAIYDNWEKELLSYQEGLLTTGIEEILGDLQMMASRYSHYESDWIKSKYRECLLNPDEQIAKGKKAAASLLDMTYRDARKEFSTNAKTGFGIDGTDETRDLDFKNTRGSAEDHPFFQ